MKCPTESDISANTLIAYPNGTNNVACVFFKLGIFQIDISLHLKVLKQHLKDSLRGFLVAELAFELSSFEVKLPDFINILMFELSQYFSGLFNSTELFLYTQKLNDQILIQTVICHRLL